MCMKVVKTRKGAVKQTREVKSTIDKMEQMAAVEHDLRGCAQPSSTLAECSLRQLR